MSTQRGKLESTNSPSLLNKLGRTCTYCGNRATCIDHIIPWSYCQSNEPTNLAPACEECNLIAGSKVFDTLELKRDYILGKIHRKRKKLISIWLKDDFAELGGTLRSAMTNVIVVPDEKAAERLECTLTRLQIKHVY